MNKLFLLLSPFIIFSCSDNSATENETQYEITHYGNSDYEAPEIIEEPEIPLINSPEDSLLLKQVEDSIWNCPKTKDLNQYIKDATNGERHLSMLTTEVGDELFIRLAEDNGGNYVTHHSFYISPLDNWSIKYYKALDGIRIDFQEWANQE